MPVNYKGLFAILRDRNIKISQMSDDLSLSSSTRAKFQKGEYVSLQTLEAICRYLGVTLNDIASFDTPQSMSVLLSQLLEEMQHKISGSIYHETQILLTYNSNHIEGSKLTPEQTRYIFETNTIGFDGAGSVNLDDIIETQNHFKCIDYMIKSAQEPLSEQLIKDLHKILKSGTKDSNLEWFAVGDYKKRLNTVGGIRTSKPEEVPNHMATLIGKYENNKSFSFSNIIQFHYEFECIHPFQDGNGRVGRLIAFKECLRHGFVPFTIDNEMKMFYYKGLKMFKEEKGFLIDTCLTGQDKYKKLLDLFGISYE